MLRPNILQNTFALLKRRSSILAKPKQARLLTISDQDIQLTARLIHAGGVVVFPFNGIYGIFGDIDNRQAAKLIYKAKNRPLDKKLIAVYPIARLHEIADLKKISQHHPVKNLSALLSDIHALGIVLPSIKKDRLSKALSNIIGLKRYFRGTPDHVTMRYVNSRTVLNIHTQYPPLIKLLEEFRKVGGRGLVGTSANKSGQATYTSFQEVCAAFSTDVHAIIDGGDFSDLPDIRKKSTSVIDLTGEQPRLHRAGNTTAEEISQILKKYNFKELFIDDNVIKVKSRKT